MNKKKLLVILFLLFFILIPSVGKAWNLGDPLVPCGNDIRQDPCNLSDFFIMLNNIYVFIIYWVATPLAVLMLTVGGIMILISAGNPQLSSKGRELIKWAIIGLVLVFCAFLIIQFILTAMGYNNIGNWNVLTN